MKLLDFGRPVALLEPANYCQHGGARARDTRPSAVHLGAFRYQRANVYRGCHAPSVTNSRPRSAFSRFAPLADRLIPVHHLLRRKRSPEAKDASRLLAD